MQLVELHTVESYLICRRRQSILTTSRVEECGRAFYWADACCVVSVMKNSPCSLECVSAFRLINGNGDEMEAAGTIKRQHSSIKCGSEARRIVRQWRWTIVALASLAALQLLWIGNRFRRDPHQISLLVRSFLLSFNCISPLGSHDKKKLKAPGGW